MDKLLSRRDFLKVAGLTGAAAATLELVTCRSREERGLTQNEIEARINYTRKRQVLTYGNDAHGNYGVVDCVFPGDVSVQAQQTAIVESNGTGFVYDHQELLWKDLNLPNIQIDGQDYPLLTSRNLESSEIENIQALHTDSQHLEKLLTGENIPSPKNRIFRTLVIDYRMIKDDYWRKGPTGCERVYDDTAAYDTMQYFNQFRDFILKCTGGLIDYRQEYFSRINESDLPLTNNLRDTFPQLIDIYKKTINYREIAKVAIQANADTVMVYTGPAGMYESVVFQENTVPITIFGFNNIDQPVESSYHSWLHYLEDLIRTKHPDLFNKISAREQEDFELPYLDYDQDVRNYQDMLKRHATYASAGLGSIHLPPNSVYHYQYDSDIPVLIPGVNDPITSAAWGKSEIGYYEFWLKSLPKSLLSVITG